MENEFKWRMPSTPTMHAQYMGRVFRVKPSEEAKVRDLLEDGFLLSRKPAKPDDLNPWQLKHLPMRLFGKTEGKHEFGSKQPPQRPFIARERHDYNQVRFGGVQDIPNVLRCAATLLDIHCLPSKARVLRETAKQIESHNKHGHSAQGDVDLPTGAAHLRPNVMPKIPNTPEGEDYIFALSLRILLNAGHHELAGKMSDVIQAHQLEKVKP